MDTGMAKNDLATLVRQLISGANKHFTPNELLRVGGATFTVTELTEVMQRFVDNKDATATQRATLAARIQAERAAAPSQLAVIRVFETVVRGAFGDAADALADFGLTPPKPRSPMTAEAAAVAVARRAATREARHTMGKNQKKKIHGSVTAALVVTPVTTSAEPAPPAPADRPPRPA
jgi:hypothetical protein